MIRLHSALAIFLLVLPAAMCAGTDTNGTSTNADNAASWGQALWNGTNLQTFLRGGVQTDETGRAFFLSFGGLTYVGDVRNGKADGWGTMSGPTGINLYGQWRNGDPYILSGSITATNGTKETGTWNYDGSKCGGTINWADGRVYKGDWKLIPNGIDLPDGVGTMTWPDGRVYVGEFRNGRMDGKGKMVNPRGITQDGLWKRDYFVSPSP